MIETDELFIDNPNIQISKLNTDEFDLQTYSIKCINTSELSSQKILETLFTMQYELMTLCSEKRIESIQCNLTPSVKTNMVQAFKKLKMYGKSLPTIACYDEYGNEILEPIKINYNLGVILNILNSEEVGELFFELRISIKIGNEGCSRNRYI